MMFVITLCFHGKYLNLPTRNQLVFEANVVFGVMVHSGGLTRVIWIVKHNLCSYVQRRDILLVNTCSSKNFVLEIYLLILIKK